MTGRKPSVIALAGPDGAGKSSVGPALVRDTLGVEEYVDADLLARGIGRSDSAGTAIRAGRLMIGKIRDLARRGVDFAFETTLSNRSFSALIADLALAGWRFELVFLWLPSPDLAIARVQSRVKLGGHAVPEEVVRRRYRGGLRNFFQLYRAPCDVMADVR